jgi:hypothetical protein
MLRNKPRLEGPLAAVGGSLIGGLIGGGGTIAGLATVGGIVGSAIGGIAASSLFKEKTPSFPTVQAPGTPAPPQIPTVPALAEPGATPTGEGASLTPAEIAAGNAQKARRGRLSTILSQQRQETAVGETTNETLG